MRGFLRALVLFCCFTAFAVAAGGHWAVLQSVAWTRMVVDYSQSSGSLREGFAKTFDGAHPCELCRKVSAGFAKESREQRQQKSEGDSFGKIKLTAVLPTALTLVFAEPGEQLPARLPLVVGELAAAPSVPPPRAA